MHPVRRNILLRWIAYVVVILGTVGYLGAGERQVKTFKSDLSQRLAPPKVALPSQAQIDAVHDASALVMGKQAAFGRVEALDPGLMLLTQAEAEAEGSLMGMVNLSSISVGSKLRMAMLNGVLYREGDVLPDGRTVTSVEADAVTLTLGESRQRIPWQPSFRVELKRPEKSKLATSQDGDDAGDAGAAGPAVAGPAAAAAGTSPAEAQGDLSPAQALQLLQNVQKK